MVNITMANRISSRGIGIMNSSNPSASLYNTVSINSERSGDVNLNIISNGSQGGVTVSHDHVIMSNINNDQLKFSVLNSEDPEPLDDLHVSHDNM